MCQSQCQSQLFLKEAALCDHILLHLAPPLASHCSLELGWALQGRGLEILIENTERARGGGAGRKTTRAGEGGWRGHSEPEMHGE